MSCGFGKANALTHSVHVSSNLDSVSRHSTGLSVALAASLQNFSMVLRSLTVQQSWHSNPPAKTTNHVQPQALDFHTPQAEVDRGHPAETAAQLTVDQPIFRQVGLQMPVPSGTLLPVSTEAKTDAKPPFTIESSKSNRTIVSREIAVPFAVGNAYSTRPNLLPVADTELSNTSATSSSDLTVCNSDAVSKKALVSEPSIPPSDMARVADPLVKQLAAEPAPTPFAIPTATSTNGSSAELLQMSQPVMQSMPQLGARARSSTSAPATPASDKVWAGKLTTKSDASQAAASFTKDCPTHGTDSRNKIKSTLGDGANFGQSTGKELQGTSSVVKMTEAASQPFLYPADRIETPAIASIDSTASLVEQPTSVNNQPATKGSVSSGAPLPTAPAYGPPDVKSPNGLNSARLLQSVHQSEMKLGMHSVEFGNISISTSINHQAISAQISTEHAELSRVLAMHISAIEEKLGNAYGVNARVELRDAGTSANTNSQQHSGQQSSASGKATAAGILSASLNLCALTTSTASSVAEDARLDIRI